MSHAYHTRVAWALLALEERAPAGRYRRAAEGLIERVVAGAQPNGWVPEMAFHPEELPFTHTIAYTYRGLLESAPYLAGELGRRAEGTVVRAAEHLLRRFELGKADPEAPPRPLPAVLGPDWRGRSTYSCLTGNAQVALVWMRLCQSNGDGRFLNGALKLLDQVKARQVLTTGDADVRGAVPGSYPIWGWYLRLAFPNWAAKFLADALMLQESLLAEPEQAP